MVGGGTLVALFGWRKLSSVVDEVQRMKIGVGGKGDSRELEGIGRDRRAGVDMHALARSDRASIGRIDGRRGGCWAIQFVARGRLQLKEGCEGCLMGCEMA